MKNSVVLDEKVPDGILPSDKHRETLLLKNLTAMLVSRYA